MQMQQDQANEDNKIRHAEERKKEIAALDHHLSSEAQKLQEKRDLIEANKRRLLEEENDIKERMEKAATQRRNSAAKAKNFATTGQ